MNYNIKKCIVLGIGGVLLVGLYYLIDPSISYFMPKCPFYLLTGFDCPACGIQRFAHHLLNGDWSVAIRYNYFLLISLPYFIAVAITTFFKGEKIKMAHRYVQHPYVVWAVLVLMILWWIIRNIPSVKIIFNML